MFHFKIERVRFKKKYWIKKKKIGSNVLINANGEVKKYKENGEMIQNKKRATTRTYTHAHTHTHTLPPRTQKNKKNFVWFDIFFLRLLHYNNVRVHNMCVCVCVV